MRFFTRRPAQLNWITAIWVILLSIATLLLLVASIRTRLFVVAAPASEVLWGTSQACAFEISNPELSLNGPTEGFDGKSAACQWDSTTAGTAWTFADFQPTSFDQVQGVNLEVAFYLESWQQGDKLEIQASSDQGINWKSLETFDENNPPPSELTSKTYEVADLFNSNAALESAQVRLASPEQWQNAGSFTVYIDGVALEVNGINEPTATLTQTEPPPVSDNPTVAPPDTVDPTQPLSTPVITATATLTPTDILSNPTLTVTLTLTPTTTSTPTLTLTPTPSLTPAPTLTLNTSQGEETQILWGTELVCSQNLANPQDGVDRAFNDKSAACEGEFARDQSGWQYNVFQHTSFTHVSDAILEIRFSLSGWVDDEVNLELFDGSQWYTLDQFGGGKSIPPITLNTLAYRIGTAFLSPVSINQVSLRLVGVKPQGDADLMTSNLDEARLSLAGGYATLLTLGPASIQSGFTAFAAASVNGSPHGDLSMLTDSCAGCHRGHTAVGTILRENWPEEAVCFTCHSSSGPGTIVQPAFTNYPNTATGFYTHDVMHTTNIHQVDQTTGAGFGGANRHVECEDCHNPHRSTRGSTTAPGIQAEMSGASGVNPVWSSPGAPTSFQWLSQATSEYQVCFKCHSSFTALPGYLPDGWNGGSIVSNGLRKLTSASTAQVADNRDLAREFNPYQTSFHPVVALGRNQNIPAASFVNGWSQGSMTYCTDCHTSTIQAGGSGPHGSSLLHLLTGQANYSTVMLNGAATITSGQVCFQCHSYGTYVAGDNDYTHFKLHAKHLHNDWGTTCYTCHDSHGSEQQHLINFDASAMTFLNNRNSQTAWYFDPTTGRAGCFVSCHSKSHNPQEYTP